jgi:hypothetical protein
METRLEVPKDWQAFERLCHLLWRDIWVDPNAQLNGRLGQPQCGVDVWGRPLYQAKHAGVQCKDKDFRFGRQLTEPDVDDACAEAVNFDPALGEFTIATTSPRDVDIQKHCRVANDSSTFPFDVHVWYWDDIEEELRFRPAILERHYPNADLSPQDATRATFSLYSPKQHNYAYFSRPIMQDRVSPGFRLFLLPLIDELTDNAHRHGKATTFSISCDESLIQLEDDGAAFDPTTDLKSENVSATSHIGSYVFSRFCAEFQDLLRTQHQRVDKNGKMWNRLSFEFLAPITSIAGVEYSEFPVDLSPVRTRQDGEKLAGTISIPQNRDELKLLVREFRTISALSGFILSVLKRLNSNMRLVVYLPPSPYVDNLESWVNDKRLSVRFR